MSPFAVAASAIADGPLSIQVQGGGSAPVKLFLLFTALTFATSVHRIIRWTSGT